MQNILGKVADLMSLLLPRSSPTMSTSGNEKADEMKLLVVDYRTHLTNAIYNGKDYTEVIQRLTELDCPLSDKYALLQVTHLLSSNSQSLEELKHILSGLAIIVKYAQHLIKRSENRRDQWRIIHYGNTVVQKKIRPMKGFETVLQQLGYTIVSPNGLCFPIEVEPNFMVIVNLIADMMLFRKEIKEYIAGKHLHAKYLQQYIPLETQHEVQTAQLSALRYEDEDYSEMSSSQTSPIAPDSHLGNMSNQATSQLASTNANLTAGAHMPDRTQPECNNNRVADEKMQTAVSVPNKTIAVPIPNKTTAVPVTTSMDVSVACESPAVSNMKEPECATEQFQGAAVGPVQAIQDLVAPINEQDTVVTESSSGRNSGLHLACTVCGDDATVYCEDCTRKKPLCETCNINWHKHPQRQGHIQKSISVFDFASLESSNPVHIDGAYGISAQSSTDSDRVRQQTYLAKQKMQNKAADKQFSPELQKRTDNEVNMNARTFYLPNEMMRNEQAKLSDYHRLQGMRPQQQQYVVHQQHYPYLANAGFDNHSASYQSQTPYNSPRLVYPGQGQGYLHSQINSSHPFRPGLESFNPRMPPRQLFDNSGLMRGYHPDVGVYSTMPYLQHQLSDPQMQSPVLQLQQPTGWPYAMVNRNHTSFPYTPELARSQNMEDFGPVSSAPTNMMSSSMFQHTNLDAMHQSANQMFPGSPQHGIRPNGGHFAMNNQQIHHQGPLLPGKINSQMNQQGEYHPNTIGQTCHPSLVVHQMRVPGMSNDIEDSQKSPSHYPTMSATRPAHQSQQQHLVSSTSFPTLDRIHNQVVDQLKYLPSVASKSAKCDEYIAALVADIQVLEQQINAAMEADVEVCETELFRSWNKEKAFLLQRKKYMEEYRLRLEDETALMKLNSDEEIAQQIHYPPEIKQSATIASRNVPVSSSEQVPDVVTSAETVPLPAFSDHTPTLSNTNNSAAVLAAVPKPPQSSIKPENTPHSTAVVSSSQLAKTHSSPPPLPHRAPQTADILNMTLPSPKAMPVSDGKNWHCQHCTFINPTGAHSCAICDNPLLGGRLQDNTNDENNSFNELQTNVMKRDRFLDLLEEIKSDKMEQKFAENDLGAGHKLDDEQTHFIGSRIIGSQEQVMMEKLAAQQKSKLQETSGRAQSASALHSSAPIRSQNSSHSPSPSSTFDSEKQQPPYKPKQGLEVNELSSEGSSEYHTTQSTPSPLYSPHGSPGSQHRQTANAESEHNEDKPASLGSFDSTLEDTLARFSEISMINNMQAQGAEFSKLIKMADKEGFTVQAVQIAQSYSDVQNVHPVEWLKQNWKKNVNMVIALAVTAGNKQQQNTVGELSMEEAESAYISCHGNIKEAVQMCVSRRTELYAHLGFFLGDYPREEILQVMFQCCGDKESAERLLIESSLRPFVENIWAEKETDARNRFAFDLSAPLPEMGHSFSTSIIFHGDFQKLVKDPSLDKDRRIRMVFVEGKLQSWGRADLVIKILDNDLPDEDISLEDVVEAVRNCQDRSSALAYLQQECALCFTNFPMSKIRNLNICQCKMCEQCLTKNFEIGLREKHVRHWTCPLCSLPDMNDTDVASDYLHFLLLLLQPLIDKDLQNLFETKVRDWHLQKDVSFRWCAHCAEGFLAENQGGHLRMTCPYCQKKTCFNCKKQWEPQHEELSCEQFAQWKIDNDPNNQSVGLAKHLDENGIDCPTCKMRFALAKGGCMHFKCPQCGHEFCSGCYEPFHQKDVCNKYKICKKLGLHCHCPRDCFSYLRDRKVEQLQQLLQMNTVDFNINTPEDQTDPLHCPVLEQKEFDTGRKDEKCGKETLQGQAGLCEIHYKEYLVYIINRHELDPVVLMTKEEMANLLHKYDIQVPKQTTKETPEIYVAQIMKIIQKDLPLRR